MRRSPIVTAPRTRVRDRSSPLAAYRRRSRADRSPPDHRQQHVGRHRDHDPHREQRARAPAKGRARPPRRTPRRPGPAVQPAQDRAARVPTALNTAKSRVRSSADRYTTEPTISTATTHSRIGPIVIEVTAAFIGRIRSATAPARSIVIAGRYLGGGAADPTDVTSGWPPYTSLLSAAVVRKTLGRLASAVEFSTMPTMCSVREPISISSPTSTPSVLDTATSSGLDGARPSEAGIPGPFSGAPNRSTFRVASPTVTVPPA